MSKSSDLYRMHKRLAAYGEDVVNLANKHSRGIETGITEDSTRDVEFAIPFKIAPVVVVGLADDEVELSVCSAFDVSETGFTIGVYKVGGGANKDRTVSWIATTSGNT